MGEIIFHGSIIGLLACLVGSVIFLLKSIRMLQAAIASNHRMIAEGKAALDKLSDSISGSGEFSTVAPGSDDAALANVKDMIPPPITLGTKPDESDNAIFSGAFGQPAASSGQHRTE